MMTEMTNGEKLREVMRFWGTGVAVVSSVNGDDRHGMTVSTFTSLSLEPPLVMVSLENSSRTHKMVKQSGFFGVSILDDSQQHLSNLFAGRETELLDRFKGLDVFSLETGSPLLTVSIAQVDCKVQAEYEAGTHTVFIGEAIAMRCTDGAEDRSPLWYYNRSYREMK